MWLRSGWHGHLSVTCESWSGRLCTSGDLFPICSSRSIRDAGAARMRLDERRTRRQGDNAVSVAGTHLLTEATMTEIPEEKKERATEADMAL